MSTESPAAQNLAGNPEQGKAEKADNRVFKMSGLAEFGLAVLATPVWVGTQVIELGNFVVTEPQKALKIASSPVMGPIGYVIGGISKLFGADKAEISDEKIRENMMSAFPSASKPNTDIELTKAQSEIVIQDYAKHSFGISASQAEIKPVVDAAFSLADSNNNGKLSRTEMTEFLEQKIKPHIEELKPLLKTALADGKLSTEELNQITGVITGNAKQPQRGGNGITG
jgi:hypothetical protein